ncbi:MAG: S1C family serine protease [Thermoguttaceae bacterium]
MSMPEFPEFPPRHETHNADRPLGPAPGAHRPQYRLPTMLFLLGLLVALLITPHLAQEISYAITRGEERAKYDVARAELQANPPGISPYRQAAKIIEPSVVGIETSRRVVLGDEWSMLPQKEYEAHGEGSGVVVDASGFILTNSHVVNDATHVDVRLSDGRTVQNAQVVGNDPLSDLALVKVDTENLTAAHWGNSDALEVGDEVLAVGNPYGLARSVTAGIISAKSRHVDIEQRERSFLQTDAAVNPGNSGGPLVNLSGEVVGINTAIVGHSYQGISFAIPSQLAERVYERLKSSGSIARGYIGVALQDLNPQLAEQLHAKNTYGAVVTGVVKGSPAAEAGIELGDVIVAVADQKINDSEDLRTAVARAKIGDSLKVAFFRDGARKEVQVTVAQRPTRPR